MVLKMRGVDCAVYDAMVESECKNRAGMTIIKCRCGASWGAA